MGASPRRGGVLGLDPDAPLCSSGKRPHRTRAEAERHLGQVRASRSSGDRVGRNRHAEADRVADEACTACGWWHLAGSAAFRPGRRRPKGNQGRRR